MDPVEFPNLAPDNYEQTSPKDKRYNCVAWAAGETDRIWQEGHGYYWPAREFGGLVKTLEEAFESIGYGRCDSQVVEAGYEKIAIYASRNEMWTHAARQLADGRWTSKLGIGHDIVHNTPEAVAGGRYGQVHCFMKRRVGQHGPAPSGFATAAAEGSSARAGQPQLDAPSLVSSIARSLKSRWRSLWRKR